ncbi:MAG: hypothetical protein V7603_2187 [Micromonosporaceae bacterium]|jgi:Arc/MetJ family transcription regulator
MTTRHIRVDDDLVDEAGELFGGSDEEAVTAALRSAVQHRKVDLLIDMMNGPAFEYDDADQLRHDARREPDHGADHAAV